MNPSTRSTAEAPSPVLSHKQDKQHSKWLESSSQIAGAIGGVTLLSTPLTWLLTEEFGPLVWTKLLLSALLLGFYWSYNTERLSASAQSRSTGLFALSGLSVVLVIGAVGVLNALVQMRSVEWDLTQGGLYTLSSQTQNTLKQLGEEIQVYAFYASYEPDYVRTQELLERYSRQSSKFSYTFVDPQSRPDLVERYQITDRGPRLVLASAAGRDARAKEPSEQDLTNALLAVTQQGDKRIYFLVGQGEGDIQDEEHAEGFKALWNAVAAEGYSVAALDLLKAAAGQGGSDKVSLSAASADANATLNVPDDAAALFVLPPKYPFKASQVDALARYLDKGGRLLVCLEPNRKSGLEDLLAAYKITVHDDLIVDPSPLGRTLGLGPTAPLIQPASPSHPIIEGLRAALVMSTVRSLAVGSGGQPGVSAEGILQTGESAWGETNLGQDQVAKRDPQDNLPPLYVAVAAKKSLAEGGSEQAPASEARLVVFGDSDWLNNRFLSSMPSNQDMILNALNWSAQQEEKISIRPKSRNASRLTLSLQQMGLLKFFSMDVLPVMLVAVGLGVVLIRRQR